MPNSARPKKPVFTYILLGLGTVVAIILVAAVLQPADYAVRRSITIAKPPATVFPLVNEMKKWESWNPWAALDPNMKLSYDGPASGVGASYSWIGNSQVGEGKLTITESNPSEEIRMKLEFFKPMPGVSDTLFTFKPEDQSTTVTWAMSGKNNFVGKLMCMFMSMDKMIGGQFEKGLATMKTVAEGKR